MGENKNTARKMIKEELVKELDKSSHGLQESIFLNEEQKFDFVG